MRKIPVAILLCTLLMSHAQAGVQEPGKNDESTFSELSQKLIQNRDERLKLISISLKCINLAKDIKGLNLCGEAEMTAIRTKMEKFCQSAIAGIEETHDSKVFWSNKSRKSSINPGEK